MVENPEGKRAVLKYLESVEGSEVVKVSYSGEYVTVKAPILSWERAFQTSFQEYIHKVHVHRTVFTTVLYVLILT